MHNCNHAELKESPCLVCGVSFERCSDGKIRRSTLPATKHERKSSENAFMAFVRRLVGMELTRAGFPINFFEPTNWLQKQAEQMMAVDKLRQAATMHSPVDRMAVVVGVCISSVNMLINSDRIMSLNPVLGETFELCRPDYGFRIIVEQVSHHPPVFTFHLDSVNKKGEPDQVYRAFGSATVKATFSGTTVEARPIGFYSFELIQRGECYTMIPPSKIIVSNLLRGLERFRHRVEGEMEIIRSLTKPDMQENDEKLRAVLKFHPPTQGTNWLGTWEDAVDPSWSDGYIENYKGEKLLSFYGKYNQEYYSVPTSVWEATGGWKKALASNKQNEKLHSKSKKNQHPHIHHHQDHSVMAAMTAHGTSLFDFGLPKQKLLWRKEPLPAVAKDYFGMSKFAMQLNERELEMNLPPTDSRCRMDLRILETGDLDKAGKEKFRIEEKQRADLRHRLAKAGLKAGDADPWTPTWFRMQPHPHVEKLKDVWIFTGEYYKRDWSRCPDLGFQQQQQVSHKAEE